MHLHKSIGLLAGLLAFLASNAQSQFQKSIGTPAEELSYQIAALPGGDLVATGTTKDVAGNGKDSYLIKFNSFGEIKWALTFGGTGDETTWDLEVTQNNHIVGVGPSGSLGTPQSGATISSTDTAGTIVWLTGVYSSSGNVDFYRVMETTTGEFVATGLVSTSANSDDVVICKFNGNGSLLWSKSVGSAQADEMMGLTETTQGDYLLAGLAE
ncbi:MAG: hypothetical protein U5L96_05960 [Owenweeksia sp.]|nr:hypothetical protein [Owenweeksia sp.]